MIPRLISWITNVLVPRDPKRLSISNLNLDSFEESNCFSHPAVHVHSERHILLLPTTPRPTQMLPPLLPLNRIPRAWNTSCKPTILVRITRGSNNYRFFFPRSDSFLKRIRSVAGDERCLVSMIWRRGGNLSLFFRWRESDRVTLSGERERTSFWCYERVSEEAKMG